jgi:hypothetical protein
MFSCLDEAGSVTITDISPVGRTTLARLDFPADREVDVECGKRGEGVEFAVEVQKTTRGAAGATGCRVSCTSSGAARSLVFPVAVRLCNEDKASAKRCRALKV